MEVVCEVLNQLDLIDKPILNVYNKCDIASGFFLGNDGVAVSAITGMGMENLKDSITKELSAERTKLSVLLPLDSGALVSRIYANGQVTDCQYREDGIHISATVSLEDASRLRASAIKIYDSL
jgi:GTP-binding protein HflX